MKCSLNGVNTEISSSVEIIQTSVQALAGGILAILDIHFRINIAPRLCKSVIGHASEAQKRTTIKYLLICNLPQTISKKRVEQFILTQVNLSSRFLSIIRDG